MRGGRSDGQNLTVAAGIGACENEGMVPSRRAPYGQRLSASAEAARRSEMKRMDRLSPWDRMLLSLELGHRARLLTDIVSTGGWRSLKRGPRR